MTKYYSLKMIASENGAYVYVYVYLPGSSSHQYIGKKLINRNYLTKVSSSDMVSKLISGEWYRLYEHAYKDFMRELGWEDLFVLEKNLSACEECGGTGYVKLFAFYSGCSKCNPMLKGQKLTFEEVNGK